MYKPLCSSSPQWRSWSRGMCRGVEPGSCIPPLNNDLFILPAHAEKQAGGTWPHKSPLASADSHGNHSSSECPLPLVMSRLKCALPLLHQQVECSVTLWEALGSLKVWRPCSVNWLHPISTSLSLKASWSGFSQTHFTARDIDAEKENDT